MDCVGGAVRAIRPNYILQEGLVAREVASEGRLEPVVPLRPPAIQHPLFQDPTAALRQVREVLESATTVKSVDPILEERALLLERAAAGLVHSYWDVTHGRLGNWLGINKRAVERWLNTLSGANRWPIGVPTFEEFRSEAGRKEREQLRNLRNQFVLEWSALELISRGEKVTVARLGKRVAVSGRLIRLWLEQLKESGLWPEGVPSLKTGRPFVEPDPEDFNWAARAIRQRGDHPDDKTLGEELETPAPTIQRHLRRLRERGQWPTEIPQKRRHAGYTRKEREAALNRKKESIEEAIRKLTAEGREITPDNLLLHLPLETKEGVNYWLRSLEEAGLRSEGLPSKESAKERRDLARERRWQEWGQELELGTAVLQEIGFPVTQGNLATLMSVQTHVVVDRLRALDQAGQWPPNIPRWKRGQRPSRASLPEGGEKLAELLEEQQWKALIALKRLRLQMEEAVLVLKTEGKRVVIGALAAQLGKKEGEVKNSLRHLRRVDDWPVGVPNNIVL